MIKLTQKPNNTILVINQWYIGSIIELVDHNREKVGSRIFMTQMGIEPNESWPVNYDVFESPTEILHLIHPK